MSRRFTKADRELVIYQLEGLREWPAGELRETFDLSPSRFSAILRRQEALGRTVVGSQVFSTENRRCDVCGKALPSRAGLRGRFPIRHEACVRFMKFWQAAMQALRSIDFADEKASGKRAAGLRRDVFTILNSMPGIERHALRGPDGKFLPAERRAA